MAARTENSISVEVDELKRVNDKITKQKVDQSALEEEIEDVAKELAELEERQ